MTLVTQGATSLGAVLAISGVSIVTFQVARRRRILGSTLAKRWMTWAVLAPIWLVASVWAPGRTAILTGFAVVAAVEFGRLDRSLTAPDRWLIAAWATISVPAFSFFGVDPLQLVVLAVLSSLVVPLVTQDVSEGPSRIAGVTIAFVVVVLPFVVLDQFATQLGGAAFFTVGLAVALSDVLAFVLGSTIGRRRIAPVLSPNKTVAGTVGNVIGASAGVGISMAVGIAAVGMWWIAPVVVVGAVVGDLFISLMKRNAGVKDAGSWLPGFGGLLDRIDSLLVSALLLYAAMGLVGMS